MTVRFEGQAVASETFQRDMHLTGWEMLGPVSAGVPPIATFFPPFEGTEADLVRDTIRKIEGAYGVTCLGWFPPPPDP